MSDDLRKDEAFVQQLRATFLDELHVHVGSLGRDLLALEGDLSDDQRAVSWTSVFRSVHTLKGASAVVDIEPIHITCHRMEDLFDIYRESNAPLPSEITSILLKIVDAMEEVGMRLRDEQDPDGTQLMQWVPELDRIIEATDSGQPVQFDPTAAKNIDGEKEDVSQDDAVPAAAFGNVVGDEDDGDFDFDATNESAAPEPASAPCINPELLSIFLEELEDRCENISQDAIAMENDTDPDQQAKLLDNLFRSAHSLKGAAGVVKLNPAQTVCHALENELDAIRTGRNSYSTQTASGLLEAVDAIREAGERLRLGQDLVGSQILALATRIESDAQGDESGSEQQPPSPSQPSAAKPTHKAAKSISTHSATPKRKPATEHTSEESSKATTAAAAAALVEHASVRVPAQKLDALLSHSGELLVARSRLDSRAADAADARELAFQLRALWRKGEQSIRSNLPESSDDVGAASPAKALIDITGSQLTALASRLELLANGMETDNRLLKQTCERLESEVMHVRMLPFSDACGGLQRAVRDIATSTAKKIMLKLEGADVEVDRSVLEGLKDPLLHLVRNAADHGVETPAQREAAGKPAMAAITVSAALRGGQVEVLVKDDGGGLDLQRICDIARKRELEIPEDSREQARLIFNPGFSTAKLITDISGRGVGLDVVKNQVESLHGSVDIAFERGQGTCFTLTVPLTLTTIRSMLVVVGDQKYAIPTTAIDRLERFSTDDLHSSGGRDSLLLGQAPIPVVSLAATLGLPSEKLIKSKSNKELAIVMCVGDQAVAMAVDDVDTEQEVLVKSLGSRVRRLRHFSGCTVLADGSVSLVVNSSNLIRSALGHRSAQVKWTKKTSSIEAGRATKSLLLAEDAVTTRVLLKNILETAGYVVTTANDGNTAWEILQEQPFDILVTDVDMPNMNGFDLTGMVRHHEHLAELPVVLVTARGADSDKERGVQVGANAYIVKGSFEQQNLLDTIAQLV